MGALFNLRAAFMFAACTLNLAAANAYANEHMEDSLSRFLIRGIPSMSSQPESDRDNPNKLTTMARRVVLSNSKLASENQARCLDGTMPVAYVAEGDPSRVIVFHQGGGWCSSTSECCQRATTPLGSSSEDKPTADLSTGGGYFNRDAEANPFFHNFTMIYLRYCDGGSFSGMKKEPQQGVCGSDGVDKLFYQGGGILDAAIDTLAPHVSKAELLVVSGCSAGGLATYLHVDKWAEHFPQARTVGMPDSGFFLDTDQGLREQFGTTHGHYETQLRWVFDAMEARGGVDQKCIAAHSGEEWRCMFAAYSAEHLVTSVFALQSVYDSWQVGNELAGDVTPESVNQYGSILRASVHKSLLSAPSGVAHGAFLDTCFHHCGKWNSMEVDGVDQTGAFASWLTSPGSRRVWEQTEAYPCDACCNRKETTSID